jgi:RHS repeat-associated protein
VVSAIPRSRREPGRAVYRTRPPRPLLHPRRLGAWLAWDNDNRLTQVQFQAGNATPNAIPLTTTYTWDADSRLTTKTLPNGITVTYTYDAASRLTRLVYRNTSNQLLEDISYSYDAAGQRTARSSTNTLGSRDVPHQASYDANNRLTSLTLNPGTPQAKTYTLSYNATGSLISKVNTDASDTSTYTWDSQQRLTQVQTPELTATYRYDLLGRRVQRQITRPGQPPETTHYVYDGLQAMGEIRPQQSSTRFLTGLNLDEMLARVTQMSLTNTYQTRTYLTDALGSVMAQTQDNQSTLAGYSYSPYGHTQSTGNTEGDSVQYTARENDANGLYYYRARYYDPVLKRFISEDPIGLQGGSLSFYA